MWIVRFKYKTGIKPFHFPRLNLQRVSIILLTIRLLCKNFNLQCYLMSTRGDQTMDRRVQALFSQVMKSPAHLKFTNYSSIFSTVKRPAQPYPDTQENLWKHWRINTRQYFREEQKVCLESFVTWEFSQFIEKH